MPLSALEQRTPLGAEARRRAGVAAHDQPCVHQADRRRAVARIRSRVIRTVVKSARAEPVVAVEVEVPLAAVAVLVAVVLDDHPKLFDQHGRPGRSPLRRRPGSRCSAAAGKPASTQAEPQLRLGIESTRSPQPGGPPHGAAAAGRARAPAPPPARWASVQCCSRIRASAAATRSTRSSSAPAASQAGSGSASRSVLSGSRRARISRTSARRVCEDEAVTARIGRASATSTRCRCEGRGHVDDDRVRSGHEYGRNAVLRSPSRPGRVRTSRTVSYRLAGRSLWTTSSTMTPDLDRRDARRVRELRPDATPRQARRANRTRARMRLGWDDSSARAPA